MRRRGRLLTREEQALWASVARAAVPLKGRAFPPAPEPVPVIQAPQSAAPPPPPALRIKSPPPPKAPPPPPLTPLERRTARALARGRKTADAVIDLHGMTQAEAHSVLIRFLYRAQASGHAIVLVVTGKGSGGLSDVTDSHRGVLRRMVPHWLTLPDLRAVVLGFEEAGPRQGGGGALYVRLRRPRGHH